MKNRCSKLHFVVLSLVSVFTVLAMAGPAAATLDCSGCHGDGVNKTTGVYGTGTDMRPADQISPAYRNISTGGVQGNHQTHMMVKVDPATKGNACAKCHGTAVTGYASNHRTGGINMRQHINSSATVRGTYSRGVFFNQTTIPLLGTCSSVNCHFKTVTPTWGATPFSSGKLAGDAANCQACHSNAALSAPHGTHLTIYTSGNNVTACVKCHLNNDQAGTAAFTHATSLAANIITTFAASPNDTTTGTISGKRAYPAYLNGGATTGVTCSNLYCHSDGTRVSGTVRSKTTTLAWNGTLGCSDCHGFNQTVAVAKQISSNRHISHINNVSAVGKNIACSECHNATTTDNVSVTTPGNHANKSVNIKFDNVINKDTDNPTYNSVAANTAGTGAVKAAGSNTTANTCANVYCHSVGNLDVANGTVVAAGGQTFKSIVWNATPVGCATNTCHGNGTVSYPVYASGAAASTTANSHVIHMSYTNFNCGNCHTTTTANGTAIDGTTPTNHINRVENVDFKSYGGMTGTYTAGADTCATTYCHSNGNGANPLTPVWGGARDCRGCHGGDGAHASTINTNKHFAHISSAGALGRGTSFRCAVCHSKTINTFANNTTITNKANHVNALKDYSGRITATATQSVGKVASGTCSSNYCHSSGAKTPVFRNMTGSKAWNGAATLNCSGCHGYGAGAFTSTFGEPNYASNGANGSTANSHQTHVANAGFTSTTQCGRCHDHTVDRVSNAKLKAYTTQHIDGNRDVIFSAAVGGTYAQASMSCSSTKCHGTGTPPVWGGAALSCNACHGATFTTFSSVTKKGAHRQHIEDDTTPSAYNTAAANVSAVGTYRFTCAACHNSPASHADLVYPTANGVAQVYFGFTSAGKKPAYNYGATTAGTDSGTFTWTGGGQTTCNTTYCHSNGQGGNGNIAVNWSNPQGFLGATCNGCHGNAASAASLSGKHSLHIGNVATGGNFGCVDCHAKTTNAGGVTIIDKSKHINKLHDYSGAKAGHNTSPGVLPACNTSYCHSNGKGVAGASVTWTAASTTSCNLCHGTSGLSFGAPDYASGAAGSLTANSHKDTSANAMSHISAATDCYTCHASSVTAAGTALVAGTTHIDRTINVNFNTAVTGASAAWTAGSKTCASVNCHFSGVTGQTGASIQWGANTTRTTCNKCHTYDTILTTDAGKFRATGGANYTSATKRQGGAAHTAHVASNSAYGHQLSSNLACTSCHANITSFGQAGHVSSTGQTVGTAGMVWSTLATGNGKTTPLYNTTTGTCSAVYCHSGSGATGVNLIGGTNTAPVWNSTPLVPGSINNCNQCHGNPPNNSNHAATPGPYVSSTSCNGCHSHVNTDGKSFNDVTKHINGTVEGGKCNACHGYPPVTVAQKAGLVNYSNARIENYSGGGGVHAVPGHLSPTIRWNTGWGTVGTTGACLTCHAKGSASHNLSFGVFSTHHVDVTVDTHFRFDKSRPIIYNGVNTGAGRKSGTCSNVSCHFQKSPVWSGVYTQGH